MSKILMSQIAQIMNQNLSFLQPHSEKFDSSFVTIVEYQEVTWPKGLTDCCPILNT